MPRRSRFSRARVSIIIVLVWRVALVLVVSCGRFGFDAECTPDVSRGCYTGQVGTLGIGPCSGGTQTCGADHTWGPCTGEVVPRGEDCSDGVDNNCNGKVDEDEDADGDGFTTCAGDCCDSTECATPADSNPARFDELGNGIDDDCSGVADDLEVCDQNLGSSSTDPFDYARAIDVCRRASDDELAWGVIDAVLTLADGTGTPAAISHSIRPTYGNAVVPERSARVVVLSTGAAAAKGDLDPDYQGVDGTQAGTSSSAPADFLAAHGDMLPNAEGCPEPSSTTANDAVMLTLRLRVPVNARSFTIKTSFFSAEYPEYTCSTFNDFFVVLLQSSYAGATPNPADGNLAIHHAADGATIPVGVNLVYGDSGLFTQCKNGTIGCSATAGTYQSCRATDLLANTGFDDPDPGSCDADSLKGGGTGWLYTSGNVVPGEIITIRIAIWDTGDDLFDSLAVIDAFEWSTQPTTTGTTIL